MPRYDTLLTLNRLLCQMTPIEDRAASIIIAHNHPSGMLGISEQDREVTRRIRQAGDIIGIRLDDHIIVAGEDFVSAY